MCNVHYEIGVVQTGSEHNVLMELFFSFYRVFADDPGQMIYMLRRYELCIYSE